MKIISTNVAKPVIIKWRGHNVTTGIFKKPTDYPLFLGKNDVQDDEVSDRRYHGGPLMACYLFAAEHYPYWRNLYPNLEWTYGMLGENLTVEGLDETQLFIGDVYKVGDALVKISEPREPCYKLGVKFGTQKILRQFLHHGHCGSYVSVLEEGKVQVGDTFQLEKRIQNTLSMSQLFNLLFLKEKDSTNLKNAIKNKALTTERKLQLKAFL